MKRKISLSIAAVAAAISTGANAVTTTYSSSASFLAALGTQVTDTYDHPDYGMGNVINNPNYDVHTDARMSAILGETDYTTTSRANFNTVTSSVNSEGPYYCNGCNGTFRLTFTSTSVGTGSGVFGAGFDFLNTTSHAFMTLGDGSTMDIALSPNAQGYFGITSDQLITSIHIGLENGGTSNESAYVFNLDNLTIGTAAVPLPAAAWLLLSGAGALATLARRRRIASAESNV